METYHLISQNPINIVELPMFCVKDALNENGNTFTPTAVKVLLSVVYTHLYKLT